MSNKPGRGKNAKSEQSLLTNAFASKPTTPTNAASEPPRAMPVWSYRTGLWKNCKRPSKLMWPLWRTRFSQSYVLLFQPFKLPFLCWFWGESRRNPTYCFYGKVPDGGFWRQFHPPAFGWPRRPHFEAAAVWRGKKWTWLKLIVYYLTILSGFKFIYPLPSEES